MYPNPIGVVLGSMVMLFVIIGVPGLFMWLFTRGDRRRRLPEEVEADRPLFWVVVDDHDLKLDDTVPRSQGLVARGSVDGRFVDVTLRPQSAGRTWVVVVRGLAAAARTKLELRREHMSDRALRAVGGSEDLEVGCVAFDKLYAIDASAWSVARGLLSHAGVQSALRDIHTYGEQAMELQGWSVRLDGGGTLTVSARGWNDDGRVVVRHAFALARALDAAKDAEPVHAQIAAAADAPRMLEASVTASALPVPVAVRAPVRRAPADDDAL
jgi:hypothetical protein